MKIQEDNKFIILLNDVIRLRLFRNTSFEMGEYIGYNLFQNNIKDIDTFKARCIFHELDHEIKIHWNLFLDLENLMLDYRKTSKFYMKEIMTKKINSESTLIGLLKYFYIDTIKVCDVDRTYHYLIKEIEKCEISIPFLSLLMLDLLPLYSSKKGDVKNIQSDLNKLLSFFRKFTSNNCFIQNPLFLGQIEQLSKGKLGCTRLFIIYAAILGLESFRCIVNPQDRYLSNSEKARIQLDISKSFWIEDDQSNLSTIFWLFEPTANGTFFLYRYKLRQDDHEQSLSFIRYEAVFFTDNTMQIIHPNYIQLVIDGKIPQETQTLYSYKVVSENGYKVIQLDSLSCNHKWLFTKKKFVELDDMNRIQYYEKKLNSTYLKKINEYSNMEYDFHIMPMATTPSYIYIKKESEKRYFRISKSLNPGLKSITTNDYGGILFFAGRIYVGFDSLAIFFDVTQEDTLQNDDILIVNSIEL